MVNEQIIELQSQVEALKNENAQLQTLLQETQNNKRNNKFNEILKEQQEKIRDLQNQVSQKNEFIQNFESSLEKQKQFYESKLLILEQQIKSKQIFETIQSQKNLEQILIESKNKSKQLQDQNQIKLQELKQKYIQDKENCLKHVQNIHKQMEDFPLCYHKLTAQMIQEESMTTDFMFNSRIQEAQLTQSQLVPPQPGAQMYKSLTKSYNEIPPDPQDMYKSQVYNQSPPELKKSINLSVKSQDLDKISDGKLSDKSSPNKHDMSFQRYKTEQQAKKLAVSQSLNDPFQAIQFYNQSLHPQPLRLNNQMRSNDTTKYHSRYENTESFNTQNSNPFQQRSFLTKSSNLTDKSDIQDKN